MKKLLAALLLGALAPSAVAQDLYDTETLRTLNFTFAQANWEALLRSNYQAQIEIPADLEVDGVVYPGIGVRIRGNTSFVALPQNSQKFSLNVTIDFTDPELDLLGYSSLNLNNSFRDPTFTREVAYNNFVENYIPNGLSNHVLVTINGENWGVYANVQQFDKTMLGEFFDDDDGLRIKMPNNPNGPGLRYFGTNPNSYDEYEIKEDGGLLDPIGALIDVCDAVSNGNLANWQTIDEVVAIDPSIWSIALEILFTDDDSYVNKGSDFVVYQDPVDGRTHILQTDGNETFTEPQWSATERFDSTARPFLNHVLSVPELRQRYMAHMRTLLEDFSWAALSPTLTAHMNLIDAHVQADPKKIYSYQNFLANFGTTTVNLGGGGPGGGSVIGLEAFVNQREALLRGDAEVNAPAPTVSWVRSSSSAPSPGDPVTITALVEDLVSGVQGVELWYRPVRTGVFQRTTMLDDGLSGDGLAGDGVYGALLPVAATAGQTIPYYVAATAGNTYGSMTFNPRRAEVAPLSIQYSFGGAGIRITEYMYSGGGGEYFELTNTTMAPIDLTGWSMDDQSEVPGSFDLSAAGTLAAGASMIVCEADPAAFAADWGLAGVAILGPNTTAGLGRNDEIHIYDAMDQEVDRLSYGDEDFNGTYRARDASAQVCSGALGADSIYDWSESMVADAWGSFTAVSGDIGTPGMFLYVDCPALGTNYCMATANSTGVPATMSAAGSRVVANNDLTVIASDLPNNSFGFFISSLTQDFVPNAGASQGNLCLGGNIGRHSRAGEIIQAGATGQVQLLLNLADMPSPTGTTAVLPGETWNFQIWYRDANPTVTSNYSDGLEITFN